MQYSEFEIAVFGSAESVCALFVATEVVPVPPPPPAAV